MTTDMFIEFLSELCSHLLPIIGVLLLIYLISLVRKIIRFFTTLETTMLAVNHTIQTTEEQIRKLDAPLNTVSELSQTVDNLHTMSQNALKSALMAIIANLNVIKDWLLGQLEKTDANENEESAEVYCNPEKADNEEGNQ